ncbi:MAG TPA: cupin domain-containing protein [Longimicrobiales bacterium]
MPDDASVTIERLTASRDARGSVVEPLASDALRRQRNVHVVLTEPGCVRGNHYHERGTEVLTVWGPALVRLREARGIRDVAVEAGVVLRFVIPPGVAHAVKNTGDGPNLLVAFNDVAHDPAAPDVVRDVLIEP